MGAGLLAIPGDTVNQVYRGAVIAGKPGSHWEGMGLKDLVARIGA